MFRKVLVANRGEIAVRIIHACRELGILPVAVYSDTDREALHVRLAGEAIRVGPPPSLQSYLDQGKIIQAAIASESEAVHPGYGFLSESATFAQRCRESGIVFVGPPTEAIRRMADKAEAKTLAHSLAIPVLTGYEGADQTDGRMSAEAQRVGYPLLIKAALGGGGKAMHVVERESGLAAVLDQARREAKAAFDDERLLLERWVTRPRHVEVQVLGDEHGHLVALGERDCSSQRRHQKVVEETPAVSLDSATRQSMSECALRFARALGYVSAGTVEFLLAPDGSFYFLEMNTRLQVEHAVTEAVFGIDLVQLQLEIAAGRPLPWATPPVPRGHAIECRIYAEDPTAGFLPATGPILAMRTPEGPGIRNDLGVEAGDEVGPFYDPLLAKVTAWGETRAQSTARMQGALQQYLVLGLSTNLALLQDTINSVEFANGSVDTGFLERELTSPSHAPPADILCAATAHLLSGSAVEAAWENPWRRLGPWQLGERDVPIRWVHTGTEYEVRAWRESGTSGAWRLRCGSDEFDWIAGARGRPIVLSRGNRKQTYDVACLDPKTWVGHLGRAWVLHSPSAISPTFARLPEGAGGKQRVEAPMPGLVIKVNVQEGDHVEEHQVLMVLEAMKMQHAIEALVAGTIGRIHCAEGDIVSAGALLLDLESLG